MVNDNYQISYELYLAENQMFSELVDIKSSLLTESANIYILNEALIDTVKKYITKVVQSIQAAWKKIVQIFEEGPDALYIKALKPFIEKATEDPKFTVAHYKTVDENRFSSIRLIPFSYDEAMKQNLSSEDDFIKAYYTMLRVEEGKSIRDAIEEFCVTDTAEFRPKLSDIKEMYDWCANKYKQQFDSINSDINLVNGSISNIETLMNNIQPSNVGETVNMFFNEAEGDNSKENDTTKIIKDPGAEDDTNNKVLKDISTYMKASTQIMTAKMNILKDRKGMYIKILSSYISPKDVVHVQPKGTNNPVGTNQNEESEQGLPKINI